MVNIKYWIEEKEKNQMKNTIFFSEEMREIDRRNGKTLLRIWNWIPTPVLSSHALEKKEEEEEKHENNNKHCKLMLFTLSHVVLSSQLGLVWFGVRLCYVYWMVMVMFRYLHGSEKSIYKRYPSLSFGSLSRNRPEKWNQTLTNTTVIDDDHHTLHCTLYTAQSACGMKNEVHKIKRAK